MPRPTPTVSTSAPNASTPTATEYTTVTAALVMVEKRPHRTSASSSTTGLMASSHDPTGTAGIEAAT